MDKAKTNPAAQPPHAISDEHLGAVEGDRADDTQQGNRNASAVDDEGLPTNTLAVFEDVLGANNDETEG